ncbi:PQQ-binding-like beta-propeller repeat protein [Chitinophaga sp. MD30]|uniref:outer membrane protein assembly factor BamB family protein n=2 Tax=Chitinophaga TaxID=79328 RepID=UPI000BAF751A|nr:PQQ-binding-like beta-propeller repeat protein [Chitinophaga sp. MD30]ASZ13420.1 metallophosphoesterase [Chitinophaga sp. MD30]
MPGIMCRSNLRAKAPIGGYNIVSVLDTALVFNERRPHTTTLPAWHIANTSRNTWQLDPFRPGYEMNQEYPQVHVRWQLQEQGDIGSAVAITGDRVVYTNTNGEIKAVQLDTGKPLWKYTTGGKIYATPLIYKQYVITPSSDGSVYCLDLTTGKLHWKYETGKAIVSSPAVYRSWVVIAGSDGHCRAWDIASGQLKWDFEGIRNFVETRPLVYQDKVIFGSWGNECYALDASSGAKAWSWSNGAANRMFSPAACWPVATAGKLYLVSPDRYMTALDVASGKENWRHRDSANWVRESIGLSADSSLVFVKTMQGHILAYAANSDTQSLVWKSPVPLGYEICPSPLNEKDGVLYVPTQSGVLYALSATSGDLRWKYKYTNCLINTAQPAGKNQVITSSADGKLICLEIVKRR